MIKDSTREQEIDKDVTMSAMDASQLLDAGGVIPCVRPTLS